MDFVFALVHYVRSVTSLCTAECESERLQTAYLMFEAFTFRVIFFPLCHKFVDTECMVGLLVCVHTQRCVHVQVNKKVEKQAYCSGKVVV